MATSVATPDYTAVCMTDCYNMQDFLLGDYSKAKRDLGWEPEITFKVSQ